MKVFQRVSDIIKFARTITKIWTDKIPDLDSTEVTGCLTMFNMVYDQVAQRINSTIVEDNRADIFTWDLINWQMEYSVLTPSDTTPWMDNFTAVSVNYKENWIDNWRKARYISLFWLENDLEYYKTKQPFSEPLFVIYDTWIFVLPVPTQNVTNWIKVYAMLDENPLQLTDSIQIPDKFAWIIALWMARYMYEARTELEKAENAENKFQTKLDEIIRNSQDKYRSPIERNLYWWWDHYYS